ncbi:MAG: hypothetical protein CBD56_03105 [Candidatus Pelagibacter sp. TMED196]|nr:MAG: hypothetical protein CBD56_03105 [Candidatus Pelagibacter sp. TMED196]|tara:strand:+ start:1571 stop:2566 length:996 start_codon:yes stop_codon:yes gene_type:complete
MEKYKCPHCKKEIELSEVYKKYVDDLATQRFKEKEKDFEEKKKQKIINDLRPELKREAEEEVKLKNDKALEKERLRANRAENHNLVLKDQFDKATRPAKQGSPEIDGEVQEIVLEKYLKNRFKSDTITPVPKGKRGADCIQEVVDKNLKCGQILWESKDTRAFQENYVKKLLSDMSENNIGFGVLAVDVLPKSCKEGFEFRENKKIILCKFDKRNLDVISSMVREYAITVTKQKLSASKNVSQSQADLWKLFKSETFLINFRNILKTSIKENKQIEKDELASVKSINNRRKIMEDRKSDLKKIILQFASVEGTSITTELLELQDADEKEIE